LASLTAVSTLTESPIAARLLNPSRTVDFDELASEWFHQVIRVEMPGFAPLAKHPRLLSKVRGAVGEALKSGASAQAIAGHPCPWTPPCALDVFFREQARAGKNGLPKPYVLAANCRGQTLLIELTVFGFACEWVQGLAERLAEAVRKKIAWGRLSNGLSIPRPEIERLQILTFAGVEVPSAPESVTMAWQTPMDATGTNPLDEPDTIIQRLARRVSGLARWQDTDVSFNVSELADQWRALTYDTSGLEPDKTFRGSARQGQWLDNPAVRGELGIDGDLAPLWSLLNIGETCHVGRGAVSGLGRYRLSW
jgi:hypothetical protein